MCDGGAQPWRQRVRGGPFWSQDLPQGRCTWVVSMGPSIHQTSPKTIQFIHQERNNVQSSQQVLLLQFYRITTFTVGKKRGKNTKEDWLLFILFKYDCTTYFLINLFLKAFILRCQYMIFRDFLHSLLKFILYFNWDE